MIDPDPTEIQDLNHDVIEIHAEGDLVFINIEPAGTGRRLVFDSAGLEGLIDVLSTFRKALPNAQ